MMINKTLLKKLRINPASKFLIINKPNLIPASVGKTLVFCQLPKNFACNGDALLFFISSKKDFIGSIPKIIPYIKSEIILWISYPIKNGNIKTDLNRDLLWQLMERNRYKAVSQISVDQTWSALRFKPEEKIKKKLPATESIDLEKKTVKIPSDFKSSLTKNKIAEKSFQSLSFTHRKEYVYWIEIAKKADTRKSRIAKAIKMLERGRSGWR